MAEKILQTRIINKNGLLTDWNSSKLPLKEGEIALAKVMITQPDETGRITENPAYLMKVGVEGKTFAESPWLFAKASDVYGWAKAESKPVYNASEIIRGSSKVDADLKAVEDAIVEINTALGADGTVAEKIKAAIEALDVEDAAVANQFVTAVSETDGKISVTRRALDAADIPTLAISKIDGLQAALDAKAVKATVEQQFQNIDTKLGTIPADKDVATLISEAKAAGTQASKDLAEYETANDARVQAIEKDYVTGTAFETFKGENTDAIEAAQSAAQKHADDAITLLTTATITPLANRVKAAEDDITTLEGKVDALSSATHFLGVKETLPAEAAKGDIVIVGNKEYVYDPEATVTVEGTKWVELGDTTAEQARIKAVEDAVTVINTSLAEGGDTAKAIKAAKAAADAAQGAADAAQGDANDALAKLEVVQGSGDGSIAKALADAKAYTDAREVVINAAIDAADDKAENAQTTANSHIADKENPHKVTKAQVGLDQVDNKSVATIKSEFTGAVEAGDDGFVTGDAVKSAIDTAKSGAEATAKGYVDALAGDGRTTQTVKGNADDNTAINTKIGTEVVRVKTADSKNQLVYGAADDVIIFDCGGPEA